MKNILVASDSFKGTYSSIEVAEIVRSHLPADRYNIRSLEISDGGEGFCSAMTSALHGEFIHLNVHNPLMKEVNAVYGVAGETAIIEIAQASGLSLLMPEEYDAWNATSYGTGEMIAHAYHQGIRRFIIGLGGSATTDCGEGMLQAVRDIVNLDECHFTIASDVSNPLCGEHGAAHVFARQKGADDDMIEQLDRRLNEFGRQLERTTGKRIIDLPGAGAAGGIGAALLSFKNTEMVSGIDLLLDAVHFEQMLREIDMVITGEGRIDYQTLFGKAPYKIATRSIKQGVPCIALYGKLQLTDEQIKSSPWNGMIQIDELSAERLEIFSELIVQKL